MIRIGLLKGYCKLPNPCSQLTTLINMNDQDLFNAALNGQTGICTNTNAGNCRSCACNYYLNVASSSSGSSGNQGLPEISGTGCLVAPTLSKQMGTCWYPYPIYSSTNRAMCDQINFIKNGANMIRVGL